MLRIEGSMICVCNLYNNITIDIGDYESRERMLEILDEIQSEYINQQNKVYQMPQW
jgi:hypothetical protein